MRREFSSYLKQQPGARMNPDICNGLSWVKAQYMVDELDSIYRETCTNLPPYIKYEGIFSVDPVEYTRNIMNKGNVITEEVLWSDVYLINIRFSYTYTSGEVEYIDNIIYMPFVRRGGIFTHSSVKYAIIPILTDRVISVKPEANQVFVKLLADKIFFYFNTPTSIIINGKKVLEYLVTLSHRPKEGVKATAKLTTTLYLLGKYGLRPLFKKYFGVNVSVVENTPESLNGIDSKKYWIFQPDPDDALMGTPFAFIIERKKISIEDYRGMRRTIAGVIYTLSNIEATYDANSLDSTTFWRGIVSNILRGTQQNFIRSMAVINERYSKMENYLDAPSKRHLILRGVVGVESFWDLLNYINNDVVKLIRENNQDIWSKYPEVNYYILYGLIAKLNNAVNTLIKTHRDDMENGRQPSFKQVRNQLMITSRFIFRSLGGTQASLAVADVNYTGDNMCIGSGVLTDLQENGNGVSRKPKKSQSLPPMAANISSFHLVVGNPLAILKRLPAPLATINPYVMVDQSTGSYIGNPEVMRDSKTIDKYLKEPLVIENSKNDKK